MDSAVPACEKICADLGCLLRLPLGTGSAVQSHQAGRIHTAGGLIQIFASAEPLSWFRLQRQNLESCVIAEVIDCFTGDMTVTAGMWVFDTWIQNRDRTDRNIMVGYSPGRLDHVYFYDFYQSTLGRQFKHMAPGFRTPNRQPSIQPGEMGTLPAVSGENRNLARIPYRGDHRPQAPDCLLAESKVLYKRVLMYRRQHLRLAFHDLFQRWEQIMLRTGAVWYPHWQAFKKAVTLADPQRPPTQRIQHSRPAVNETASGQVW